MLKVQGSIALCISDPKFNMVAIRVQNNVKQMPGYRERDLSQGHKGAQIQVFRRRNPEPDFSSKIQNFIHIQTILSLIFPSNLNQFSKNLKSVFSKS